MASDTGPGNAGRSIVRAGSADKEPMAVHERRKWNDSACKYDRRMEPRNGVDVGLDWTAATGDPTRVVDVHGSSDARIPVDARGRSLECATLDDGNSNRKGPNRKESHPRRTWPRTGRYRGGLKGRASGKVLCEKRALRRSETPHGRTRAHGGKDTRAGIARLGWCECCTLKGAPDRGKNRKRESAPKGGETDIGDAKATQEKGSRKMDKPLSN